jgi:hypothetical protein
MMLLVVLLFQFIFLQVPRKCYFINSFERIGSTNLSNVFRIHDLKLKNTDLRRINIVRIRSQITFHVDSEFKTALYCK